MQATLHAGRLSVVQIIPERGRSVPSQQAYRPLSRIERGEPVDGMAQVVAEELGGIPMSSALQTTLLRAREYAIGQAHREVTLEHLLLALSEDEDATAVLLACRLDLARLRNDIAAYLGDLTDRATAPGAGPAISPALTQILKYATLAAKQGRRPRIDGAIVLAAIVGDGKSMAAGFLKAQGLTFEEAVRVLQQTIREGARSEARSALPSPDVSVNPQPPRLTPPAPPAQQALVPRTSKADDILAAARERVMSRVPQQSVAEPDPTPPPALAPTPPAISDTLTTSPGVEPDGGIAPDPAPASASSIAPPVPSPAASATVAPAATTVERSEPPEVSAPASPPPPASWAPPPLPAPAATATQAHGRNGPAVNGQSRPPVSPPPGMRPPLPPLAPLPNAPRPTPSDIASAPPSPPAPPPWSAPPDRRPPMVPLPSPSRTGGPPPTGAPTPGLVPAAATQGWHDQPPHAPAGAHQPRTPAIEVSHLAHNIPARLTLGQTQSVEIQIKRSPLNPGGPNSRPSPDRRDVVTARAISVRLRPAKGRFIIDQSSPETQWDKAIDGARLGGETAVWRLTIQPQMLGAGELLLAVTARTVTADGMIIETPLPDQTFEVRTRRDLTRTLVWFGTLALVAVASVAVLEFTELLLGVNPLRALRDFVWR